MGKKILSLYLIAFLLGTPAFAIAEEPVQEYNLIPLETGDPAPFDGVLISLDMAAQLTVEKKFEDAECDLRVEYQLAVQKDKYELLLSYKDIEIHSWKDKYESMMILKTAENDRLTDLVTKQKPASGPLLVALGFGIGTLTSLGIFALSTEIVRE